MTDRFDVAIIGAGIVGASVAYHLRPGTRALVLEGERAAGYHSTGRSAALFAASYGPPAVRALTRGSLPFFQAPAAGFAEQPLLAARGILLPARDEQIAAARRLVDALRAEGAPLRLLARHEALAAVPVLKAQACAAAVHDPQAFDIDVDALLQGFLRGAKSHGIQVELAAVVAAIEPAPTGWHIALGDGRTCQAQVVVNAAGAWADEVARLAGVGPIGLEPRRRSAFLFDAPAGVDCRHWPAVIALDESWYFKPDAGALLGSPANADPVPPHDVVPEELDIAQGIFDIEQATTLRIRRPKRTWAGLRSFVADGEPVCGFDPMAPGFFWAAALGGYGIQSAPAFGRLCASLLHGDGVPAELCAAGLSAGALAPRRADPVAAPQPATATP